jgi:hypothetical protein
VHVITEFIIHEEWKYLDTIVPVEDKDKECCSNEIDFKKLLTILLCLVGFAELVLCGLSNFSFFDRSTFFNFTIALCCYGAELTVGILCCKRSRNKKLSMK